MNETIKLLTGGISAVDLYLKLTIVLHSVLTHPTGRKSLLSALVNIFWTQIYKNYSVTA